MNYINAVFMVLGPSITLYIMLITFGVLDHNRKLKLDLKNILVILFCGLILVLNAQVNSFFPRAIVNFVITMALSMYIYKENILKTFMYTLITFILVGFFEIVFSILVINSQIIDLNDFDDQVIIKTLFSIIITLGSYYLCHVNLLNKTINKVVDKLNRINYISFFLFAILLFLMLVDTNGLKYFKLDAYINNIILIASISLIIIFGLSSYLKANKEVEKTETLLNFLKRYEKIIDDDRENRHEMLNNLLILKSVEDKNTDEYNEILNDLITSYNKKGIGIKNIYKLPSGLKGLFYYRLSGLSDKGININVNISKQFNLTEKDLSHMEYVSLCRIIGITLDNAIEATMISKNKIINIDAYKEKKDYVICIDNSFSKKVDLKKLGTKNYSTKGKGRGLGLHIVKKLLNENDRLVMNQDINNKLFITKITIKEKTS